jgi:hypothetical protein
VPSCSTWRTSAGRALLAGLRGVVGALPVRHGFLYDVEHGIFTAGGGGAIEAGIVAVTLLFSLTVLRFAWTRRDVLLAGHPI